METWFLLALASAVAGGLGAFVHKVVAVRGSDVTVFSAYSSLISAGVLFILTMFLSGFSYIWELSTFVALLGGVTYLFTLILKIEALKEIDSAIFFPLYKVAGPLIVIALGVVLFSESFSTIEWIGLAASVTVPIMLVTKSENIRQKNLYRGIYILLGAAVIGSISAAFFKYGADITHNLWFYVLAGDIFMVVGAFMMLARKHKRAMKRFLAQETNGKSMRLAFVMGVLQAAGGATMIFAFAGGGPLGIVYTINSLYILIPIVLSIIFYNEHWNIRKVVAIILSVAAIALLG